MLYAINNKPDQRGFIAGYALFGIAVVSMLVATIAMMSRDAGQKKYMHNNKEELVFQLHMIRDAVSQCAFLYQSGDNGSGFHIAYPAGTATAVSALTCPGDPATNNSLWLGHDGHVLNKMPPGFTDWVYTNDATGIYVQTTASASTLDTAVLTSTASRFSTQEAAITGQTLKFWILKE